MPPVGRKRWNLHDGPQGSLRRLRNQLAEDGCAESQVVLAKQLLEEKCELEADRLSNFKQALDWLICATEQAHPEARKMLRRCIRSSVLDEDSAAIVRAKSCLAASRQEAIARKAARDLFASLSNGEQYITTAQLERRIREICTTKLAKDEEDSDVPDDEATVTRALNGAPALEAAGDAALGAPATPDDTSCEANDDIRNLTVDDVVSAAVYYCHGELPIISDELTLRDPSPKALDRIPFFHRAILHPRLYFHILYLKLLQCLGSFKLHLSIIEFVVIPALYIFTYAYSLSVLATSCIYYLSFGYMVVSTFNMLYTKRQFVDFRMWSGLFLRYSDGNLQADESENLFIKNNIRPYFFFFGALFLNLLIYPTAIPMLPYSEFCVLALILMFATLLNFGEKGCPDVLSLVSFGINVLAKYPYEKDTVVYKGWRFLDLHASNYPSYILCNSIEFSMNARGFLSLLIPVILFFMARKNNWQGFYTKALPHCVTLSWLQMFITFSTGSTRYGFVRSVLALVCAFTCLPFIGVITLTLPFVALFEYVSLPDLAYVASIMLAFFVCLVITYLFLKSDIMRKFVTPFQFILALACLLYFGQKILILVQEDRLQTVFIELIGEDKTSMKNLLKNEYVTEFDDTNYQITWEEYYTQCHAPSWDINNMAATQIKCSFLEGSTVYWEGYVKEVRLKYFTNSYSFVAMLLPDFVQELYKCYYGDEYSTLCQEVRNAESVKDCDFVRDTARKIGKSCHLDKYNKYTTDLVLNMEASGGLLKRRAEISVSFDHHFINYTQTLRADDKISFKGVLTNDFGYYQIGSKDLYISGYEISCIDCKRAKGTITWKERKLSDYYRTITNDVVIAGKYVLNFLFNPIIVFK